MIENIFVAGDLQWQRNICVSYALFLAKALGIEEAFKPNIKRWTDMLFEREAFKKAASYKHDE